MLPLRACCSVSSQHNTHDFGLWEATGYPEETHTAMRRTCKLHTERTKTGAWIPQRLQTLCSRTALAGLQTQIRNAGLRRFSIQSLSFPPSTPNEPPQHLQVFRKFVSNRSQNCFRRRALQRCWLTQGSSCLLRGALSKSFGELTRKKISQRLRLMCDVNHHFQNCKTTAQIGTIRSALMTGNVPVPVFSYQLGTRYNN